jgi:hypothetical protein
VELRHSGSIARKDLSEVSDEELLDIIYTVGGEIGLAPVKAIEPAAKVSSTEPNGAGLLRLVPNV